jgi:hypothetical protein
MCQLLLYQLTISSQTMFQTITRSVSAADVQTSQCSRSPGSASRTPLSLFASILLSDRDSSYVFYYILCLPEGSPRRTWEGLMRRLILYSLEGTFMMCRGTQLPQRYTNGSTISRKCHSDRAVGVFHCLESVHASRISDMLVTLQKKC